MDYNKLDEGLFEGQTAHVYLVRLPTITRLHISDTPMPEARLDDYHRKQIQVVSAPKAPSEKLADVVARLELDMRAYNPPPKSLKLSRVRGP